MKLANQVPSFLALKLSGATCLALSATGCQSAQNRGDRLEPQSAPAAHIYEFESDASGFNTKTFFYDNGQEVIAFDSQFTPELAKKAIEFLKSKTANPITTLVLTHPNPDKFNGIAVFQDLGVKVIASTQTAQAMPAVHDYKKYYFVNIAHMFDAESYPKLSSPNQTFEKNSEISLQNGEKIKLQVLAKPGVSSTQTVAYIPRVSSWIVGDLIHNQAHAWLEGGIVNGKATPTLNTWIQDLTELKSLSANCNEAVVYGGRGVAGPLCKSVDKQINYLKKADAIVSSYIQNLGDRKSELQGVAATDHYLALQKQFENEFPDYQLSYLIQYGIYGLVNSKL